MVLDLIALASHIRSINRTALQFRADSGPQSRAGVAVDKENLQKGDLIFFAHDQGKGSVHHVAMYIGDGNMIHLTKS